MHMNIEILPKFSILQLLRLGYLDTFPIGSTCHPSFNWSIDWKKWFLLWKSGVIWQPWNNLADLKRKERKTYLRKQQLVVWQLRASVHEYFSSYIRLNSERLDPNRRQKSPVFCLRKGVKICQIKYLLWWSVVNKGAAESNFFFFFFVLKIGFNVFLTQNLNIRQAWWRQLMEKSWIWGE